MIDRRKETGGELLVKWAELVNLVYKNEGKDVQFTPPVDYKHLNPYYHSACVYALKLTQEEINESDLIYSREWRDIPERYCVVLGDYEIRSWIKPIQIADVEACETEHAKLIFKYRNHHLTQQVHESIEQIQRLDALIVPQLEEFTLSAELPGFCELRKQA